MIDALSLEGSVRWRETAIDRDTLAARSAAFAAELAALPTGTLIALRIGNEPAFLVALLACLGARRAAVLFDPLWTVEELAQAGERVGPALLVQAEADALPGATGWLLDAVGNLRGRSGAAAPPARHDLRDVAVVHWSSGSTGPPKPIALSRTALAFRVTSHAAAFGMAPGDRVLCVVPLSHSHGLDCIGLPTLAAGAELVLMEPRAASPASVARAIEQHAVTHFSALPRFYGQLLEESVEPALLRTLRVPLCGSAALAPDVARAFAARYGVAIRAGYGMTEIGVICCNGAPPRFDAVGPVLPGLEWRIHEPDAEGVGELWVRSPGGAHGYLGDETDRERTPDGWWRTQDLVREHADGALSIVGRSSGFINVNGAKADPHEIERAIESLPWVAECAVRGVVDASLLERVVAWVAPRPGALVTHPEAAVQQRVAETLSVFKVPSQVVVLDALPRSTLGKLLYARLPAPPACDAAAPVPPGNDLERELARAWAEVLGLPSVGVADNFFTLGGDSLRLTQLLAVLRARFAPELTHVDLFRHPTVRALGEALRGASPSRAVEQARELGQRQRAALRRRAP